MQNIYLNSILNFRHMFLQSALQNDEEKIDSASPHSDIITKWRLQRKNSLFPEKSLRSFVWMWVRVMFFLLLFHLMVNKTRKCSHKLLAFKHIVLERTVLFFLFHISPHIAFLPDILWYSYPQPVPFSSHAHEKKLYFPVCVIFPLNLTHISLLLMLNTIVWYSSKIARFSSLSHSL